MPKSDMQLPESFVVASDGAEKYESDPEKSEFLLRKWKLMEDKMEADEQAAAGGADASGTEEKIMAGGEKSPPITPEKKTGWSPSDSYRTDFTTPTFLVYEDSVPPSPDTGRASDKPQELLAERPGSSATHTSTNPKQQQRPTPARPPQRNSTGATSPREPTGGRGAGVLEEARRGPALPAPAEPSSKELKTMAGHYASDSHWICVAGLADWLTDIDKLLDRIYWKNGGADTAPHLNFLEVGTSNYNTIGQYHFGVDNSCSHRYACDMAKWFPLWAGRNGTAPVGTGKLPCCGPRGLMVELDPDRCVAVFSFRPLPRRTTSVLLNQPETHFNRQPKPYGPIDNLNHFLREAPIPTTRKVHTIAKK